MDTFVRFQTQLRCRHTGRPAGLFQAAGRVQDRRYVPEVTGERLREVLRWFNEHLTVPSLEDDQWRCLFWFRCESQQVIRRMWELVYLLEDEGVFVRKVRTTTPGTIVYRDSHQIAAVPHRDSVALRR